MEILYFMLAIFGKVFDNFLNTQRIDLGIYLRIFDFILGNSLFDILWLFFLTSDLIILHGYNYEFRNHLTNNNKKWEDPKNMIRKMINRTWTKWEIKCDSGRHTKTLDLAPLKSKTEKKLFGG